MAPVHSYSNWNKRRSDDVEQVEPYQKFFFICEGVNTETWYFKRLVDLQKQLGFHSRIDIRLLEKTDRDRDISYPKRLISFADDQKKDPEIEFDKEHDRMIIVFDADIFESKVKNYTEILETAKENGDILAITNPSFELFLLLHYDGSYESSILPHIDEILRNEKEGNQTYIYKLLLEKSGMNSKKNSRIGELAQYIDIAIKQEKNLNQDITRCSGQVTCNIGKVIDDIRNISITQNAVQ
ncbi:RloB family protein [Solibaculum mannosilyticum]|uniref:RloB family protein n=1 Tax=Solibaculum mannosilyticum TaxID=2780922 RepID=UPI0007A93065|nr:hypothetical protein BN3661_00447 [Eubacteriaceae bacterium CHKCI005]